MNVNVLIDALVRQTTVLIAQLATAAGGRASLANTANQVFADLVRELKEQGVGNKVIADMFGLALRTYHRKIQRLSESTTVRGRSLWEAILEYVREQGSVQQTDVLQRFSRDDEATVRSVLADLVDSGIIFQKGRGLQRVYRAAKPEEFDAGEPAVDLEAETYLVWVAVSRFGPISVDDLLGAVALDRPSVEAALARLTSDGRVAASDRAGAVHYATDLCFIPLGTPVGWEAAVFDHYQAVVTAICAKLRNGNTKASLADHVGGSTYAVTVWKDHPHYEEVLGLLGRFRVEANALRAKVSAFNASHEAPETSVRVIQYVGQTVLDGGSETEDES